MWSHYYMIIFHSEQSGENCDMIKKLEQKQFSEAQLWAQKLFVRWLLVKLEQLKCLHSEISPAAPWLPILVIHIKSQVKTRQSQSYKFPKISKNSNFEILQETLHATHLLKLLDKMHKYEMDPTRTVGTTELTPDAGQMDRQMVWNQYTPNNFVVRGYNKGSSHGIFSAIVGDPYLENVT